jgi:uncharacterized protein YfdQ (DUF2303 family)
MDQPDLNAVLTNIQDTARQASSPALETLAFRDTKEGVVDIPLAFVPDGQGRTRVVPLLEHLQAATLHAKNARLAAALGPDRRQGTARHQSLGSFTQHVNRFQDEHSAVWAHREGQKATLVAILDYHTAGAAGAPRWGYHRAEYPCPLSAAWTEWGAGQTLQLSQEEMAEFLEEHDYQLIAAPLNGGISPSPAVLITMANQLEVYSNATATRERDPQTNKLRISFTETKGVNGTIQPPSAFKILIPVFEDADAEEIEVRLRVKVEGAKALFELRIHNADGVYQKSFERVRNEVMLQTKLPVFQGYPEKRTE